MKLSLIAHGLPPRECTGVEVHGERLAAALVRQGVEVDLIVPRSEVLGAGTVARERRGKLRIHWVSTPTGRWRGLDHEARGHIGRALGGILDRGPCDGVIWLQAGGQLESLRRAVAARGLPQWLIAHDDALICERDNLVRADGSTCVTLGDPGACALCVDGASAVDDQGATPRDSWAHARRERMERWLGELRGVLVPTEHLAGRLRAGGVPGEVIERHTCGVDLDALEGVEASRARTGRGPLRFGYLGALIPSKGPHVFLAAARRLAEGAEFVLRGSGPERDYVEGLRSTCSELGLPWRGGYAPSELPAVLGSIDVLVVPSLWNENAPFVIREAQAAGRIVLASRGGALPESVRDGVDGALVEPGEVGAWVEAMGRLIEDRSLAQRWSEGVRQPLGIEAEARELRRRVAAALEQKNSGGGGDGGMEPSVPGGAGELASLADLRRSRARMAKLDLATLGGACLEGLGRLEEATDAREPAEGGEASALEQRLQSAWAEREAELAWLRARVRDAEGAAAHWKSGVEKLEVERDWLKGVLEDRERGLAEWKRRFEGLEVERASRVEEVEWLRAGGRAAAEEIEFLGQALEDLRAEHRARGAALGACEVEVERAQGAEREAARYAHSLERALSELRGHAEFLEERLHEFAWKVESLGDRRSGLAGEGDVLGSVRRFLAGVDVLRSELEWRRGEMSAAAHGGGGLWKRLRPWTRVGSRLEAWAKLEPRSPSEGDRGIGGAEPTGGRGDADGGGA